MRSKLFVFLFTALISVSACAYRLKDIHLSQNEYERWVLPQLKKISLDYQELITRMNPHIENYKQVIKLYSELTQQEKSLSLSCLQTQKKSCLESLNSSIQKLGKILELTDSFKSMPGVLGKTEKEVTLRTYNYYSTFRNDLFNLYFQFINFKFFYEAKLENIDTPKNLLKKINESHTDYNMFVLSNTDYRFNQSFISFWNSFIKPLNTSILTTKKKSAFIRKINDLNLRWNVMHAELTKRNKEISLPAKSLLQTMHNRWNQSLKVTLR